MENNSILDVFFDLDHTLWDFDRNSRLAFERVFRKHNIDLDLNRFIEQYEPINLRYWKKFQEDAISKEQLRRGRLIDALGTLNIALTLDEIDNLAHHYIAELPGDNYLFDYALEALDYLKMKYNLHIITNGFEEVQLLKLRNSGIQNYFQTITTSDKVGRKKPHPYIFQTALKNADAKPHSSIMIGDSWEADIMGAKNSGMHTLFFNYRNECIDPKYLSIRKLSEIKNFL